ncbi:MAG: DUF4345 family protein [Cyclobacteriaceae bacterium]
MEIVNIIVLSLSGLLLTYAGTMRLIKPLKSLCLKTYLDSPEIKLEGKVDIFNEMRGAGTSIAFGGVTILLGIVIPQLVLASFVVAIVIFLGHALGRLVSLRLDGKAGHQITQGLIMELVLGAANTFCLISTL